MQFRGKQVAAASGAVAAAIALAACSSSSSSSSTTPAATSSSTAAAASSSATTSTSSASGTINGAGSTFQTTFQQAAISAFKSVDPSITVNYDSGWLRHRPQRPVLEHRALRRLGLAHPGQGGVQGSRGQDGAVLPGADRPDRDCLQPVRRQRPEAGRDGPRAASSRARSRPGTTRRSRHSTRASACRSTSITSRSARTPPAPRELLAVPEDAAPSVWTLGTALHRQVAVHRPRRRAERRGGDDRQVDLRRHRLRRLLRPPRRPA